jgi:hypothetical protein
MITPHHLDNSTVGRSRLVPGIRRSARFNEKDMGLVFSDRSVLYALGHHKYLARAKPNSAVSQLNSDMPNEKNVESLSARFIAFMISNLLF